MAKVITIMGSSRSKGNTFKAVQDLDPKGETTFVDLKELDISVYDYEHRNKGDDFLPLIEQVVLHDVIVLATPVYWYTMSGHMKIFFDRITDCLTIEKDLGRKLRGKKVFLLISQDGPLDRELFEYPLKATVEYLGMEYGGSFYHYSGVDEKLLSKNKDVGSFLEKILS
ncbi:NAD(P)H-dependent oxidoreductase [bacterium]|nr:NAD(P)H-dependent oxidoreductase [bacterium]